MAVVYEAKGLNIQRCLWCGLKRGALSQCGRQALVGYNSKEDEVVEAHLHIYFKAEPNQNAVHERDLLWRLSAPVPAAYGTSRCISFNLFHKEAKRPHLSAANDAFVDRNCYPGTIPIDEVRDIIRSLLK